MREPLVKRRMIEIREREPTRDDERVGLVLPEPQARHHQQSRERKTREDRDRLPGGGFAHQPVFPPWPPGMKASKAAQNWSR